MPGSSSSTTGRWLGETAIGPPHAHSTDRPSSPERSGPGRARRWRPSAGPPGLALGAVARTRAAPQPKRCARRHGGRVHHLRREPWRSRTRRWSSRSPQAAPDGLQDTTRARQAERQAGCFSGARPTRVPPVASNGLALGLLDRGRCVRRPYSDLAVLALGETKNGRDRGVLDSSTPPRSPAGAAWWVSRARLQLSPSCRRAPPGEQRLSQRALHLLW